MLLTITTTRAPATDLGYLLHKHPGRLQTLATAAGPATPGLPSRSTRGPCDGRRSVTGAGGTMAS